MIVINKIDDVGLITKNQILYSRIYENDYIEDFNKLKQKGIIGSSSCFYDEKWICKIGGEEFYINFTIDELFFIKISSLRNIKINFKDFNLAFRKFIIEKIKVLSKGRLASLSTLLRNIIEKTLFFEQQKVKNIVPFIQTNFFSVNNVLEFFDFFTDFKIPDIYFDIIDETEVNNSNKSRLLPNFESVFDFIDIINHFKNKANKEDLIEYFPILIWWNISSIIPLRPSELLKIRYNCLENDGEKYYINLRRTISKGSKVNKKGGLNIDDLYKDDKIEMSQECYDLIEKYREYVRLYCPDDKKEFLFSKKMYKISIPETKQRQKINKNIITSIELKNLLNKFYIEIVQNKYGRQIIERNETNHKNNMSDETFIERMTPYDSRHIAIINLILMGNEHQTVMRMADHSRIETTLGYYNHIEEYSNAYSISYAKYLLAKKSKRSLETDAFSGFNTNSAVANWNKISNKKNEYKEVNGGQCSYHLNDFIPCFAVEGVHSKCSYFVSTNNESLIDDINKITEELNSEIKTLKEIVFNSEGLINFTERYSVITESIRNNMNTKAEMIYKLNDIE